MITLHLSAENLSLNLDGYYQRMERLIGVRNGELMIGVTDVLNKTTDPVFDVGYLTAHETPGRMFFARLQLKF